MSQPVPPPDYSKGETYVGLLTDEIERLREALREIRDGIFSGNQAAEWARKALADMGRNEGQESAK